MVEQDDARPQRIVRIFHALQQPGLQQQPHVAVAREQRNLELHGDVVRGAREVPVVEQAQHASMRPRLDLDFSGTPVPFKSLPWCDGRVLRSAMQIGPSARYADDIGRAAVSPHGPRAEGQSLT